MTKPDIHRVEVAFRIETDPAAVNEVMTGFLPRIGETIVFGETTNDAFVGEFTIVAVHWDMGYEDGSVGADVMLRSITSWRAVG